ncbi:hypothetical protein, partial [Klebsiella pneumoniae]|uniref:hypothetical protein n=1 Tax=Klebsiella pneumoniae TaxID=573 RepID=UPI00195358A1
RTALGVDVGAVVDMQMLGAPGVQRHRQRAVSGVEKGQSRCSMSVALEDRLLLGREGLVGAVEVAGQHAQG